MEYFGDKYLELCDELGNLSLKEIVDYEIIMHAGVLSPMELAFYMKTPDKIINSTKCVIEMNKSPKDKHNEILKKYGLKPIEISKAKDYIS